jgi:NAD(P)-dependent dehydrogenase (short-subunit alcohol dehydrogenase family)
MRMGWVRFMSSNAYRDAAGSSLDGPRAIFQKTDVTNWSQLDQTFKTAREEFNGADIICPGAGVFEPVYSPFSPLMLLSADKIQPFSNFWHPPGKPQSKTDLDEYLETSSFASGRRTKSAKMTLHCFWRRSLAKQ